MLILISANLAHLSNIRLYDLLFVLVLFGVPGVKKKSRFNPRSVPAIAFARVDLGNAADDNRPAT